MLLHPSLKPLKEDLKHHLIFKQVRQATGGSFCFLKKKKRKKVRIEEKGARRLGSSFGDILETLYLAMLFYLHPSFIYSFWALKIDFLTV